MLKLLTPADLTVPCKYTTEPRRLFMWEVTTVGRPNQRINTRADDVSKYQAGRMHLLKTTPAPDSNVLSDP
jgi:hypothetical protein